MYWQGDFISEPPSHHKIPSSPPLRNVSKAHVMHPLQQPILGLGLSPESANSLAAIGDDFKEGCASLLLLVRLVVAALLQSEA